jgi:small subunit ribosomal protein S8
MTRALANILLQEGLVKEVLMSSYPKKGKQLSIFLRLKYYGIHDIPVITNLKRVSCSGVRVYVNHKEIPKVRGGSGLVILSTSRGVITDREAKFHKLGGEVICSIILL